VLDKLLTNMPEVVRAISEPLSKVDKVTIVSTGANGNGSNGSGVGASRLTGDIVNMVAQVPALFELLSGTRIGDLMNNIPTMASQNGQNSSNGNSNGNGTKSVAVNGKLSTVDSTAADSK
jgi:flotillin